MADWFVARFLDEWEEHTRGTASKVTTYDKACLEAELDASITNLRCRGPAHPGDRSCGVADRLMNQFHNEFVRLEKVVAREHKHELVTDSDRMRHFMLRARELVAAESNLCELPRLETIRNPFLTPSQCRACVRDDNLGFLKQRDQEVIESRRLQLLGALRRVLYTGPHTTASAW